MLKQKEVALKDRARHEPRALFVLRPESHVMCLPEPMILQQVEVVEVAVQAMVNRELGEDLRSSIRPRERPESDSQL